MRSVDLRACKTSPPVHTLVRLRATEDPTPRPSPLRRTESVRKGLSLDIPLRVFRVPRSRCASWAHTLCRVANPSGHGPWESTVSGNFGKGKINGHVLPRERRKQKVYHEERCKRTSGSAHEGHPAGGRGRAPEGPGVGHARLLPSQYSTPSGKQSQARRSEESWRGSSSAKRTAFAEDTGLISSTHGEVHNHLQLQSQAI